MQLPASAFALRRRLDVVIEQLDPRDALRDLAMDAARLIDSLLSNETEISRLLAGLQRIFDEMRDHCGNQNRAVVRESRLPTDFDGELFDDFIEESQSRLRAAETALHSLGFNAGNTEALDEVFRAFHTIKGIAGFLGISVVTTYAHRSESFLDRMRAGELERCGEQVNLAYRALEVLRNLMNALPAAALSGTVPVPPDYYYSLAAMDRQCSAGGMAGAVEENDGGNSDAIANSSRVRETADRRAAEFEQTVKVRVSRLDKLMNLVEELMSAQAAVRQNPASGQYSDLTTAIKQLSALTHSLREHCFSLRTLSLKATFQRMARLAEELSVRSGKDIILETLGEDTEVDHRIVNTIADSLMHIVKNAVDHGIEPPDVRLSNKKPEKGKVRLSAAHENDAVVISVSDDGRGLNPERISQIAVQRKLIDSVDGLSEAELFNLILQPGLSTAKEVTEISGRGVGLDIVRSNIQAIGGTVEISSQLEIGTTFRMLIPVRPHGVTK